MTETLSRPRPSPMPPRPSAETRNPLGIGAAAAMWAAVLGLLCVGLPVLLAWWADSRSGTGATEALRSAGRLWLVAHGVSLEVPGGRFSLTPLGLLLLPLLLVSRFAASAARDLRPSSGGAAGRLALCVAAPYGVLALLVAIVCTGPDVHVSPVPSLVGGFLLAGAGAAVGVLRPDGLWRTVWSGRSARTRRLVPAAGGAVAALGGAAALLVGGSLVAHFPTATELAGAGDPGPVGGLGLLLACLALVPNAVVWGISWLAGPGFAVGVGTAVGPFGHELGPVPALPLLAALPGGGIPEWAGVLVLAVPLLAGALAGRHLANAQADVPSARRTAVEAALVGPLAGAVVALLGWMSGGAAGGDRLTAVGPSAWSLLLAVSATVGVGSVAGALVRRARLLS